MNIDTTHGIVQNANQALFVHRNLLDSAMFEEHLRGREQPYDPLQSVVKGTGTALTLDDSTRAAADAAKLARRLGHAVTLFINGFHIAEGRPYFFSRLNVVLDTTDMAAVDYDGICWTLSERIGKERFRKVVKKRLAAIGDENQRDEVVTEIAELLGRKDASVPDHLRVITLDELRELVQIGVDIQNHGWTHSRVGAMSATAHAEDIRKGREWLRRTCGIEADLYAVPNGDGLPTDGQFRHCRAWFLLDDSRPYGEVFPGVFGRRTLLL